MHACAGHSVEFYDDDKVLVVSVTDHIRPALGQRGAAVVIATPEHRAAFQRSLRGRGADVDAALRDGRLQMLDAAETLACFTDGDGPDAERFVATVGPVLDRAEAAAGDGPVRAYGEMVALLWQDGQARMALELEDHWNDLGEQRAFELMCAYPMDCFAGEIHAAGFARVCEQHDVVVPAHRPTDARDSGRLIAGLQQQVWGLRSDIARDPTTGAASRRHFETALRDAWRAAGEALVVVADVDAFKTLNDTHGHAHGDAVLRRVADALARAAGDGGLVGRIGGDEFAVLLDGRTERDGPGFAAEVDRALAITPVSVSMGWAALPTARSPAVALEAADLAMYARKHARLEPAWAVGLRQRAQAAVRRARVLRRRVIEVRGAARAGRG